MATPPTGATMKIITRIANSLAKSLKSTAYILSQGDLRKKRERIFPARFGNCSFQICYIMFADTVIVPTKKEISAPRSCIAILGFLLIA